jgi:hypothetical protein
MIKSLSIVVLSALLFPVFNVPVNAQVVYDYTWGGIGRSVLDAE